MVSGLLDILLWLQENERTKDLICCDGLDQEVCCTRSHGGDGALNGTEDGGDADVKLGLKCPHLADDRKERPSVDVDLRHHHLDRAVAQWFEDGGEGTVGSDDPESAPSKAFNHTGARRTLPVYDIHQPVGPYSVGAVSWLSRGTPR
jgi:hypothetical protein